ncbi:MAG: hypothetical protein QHH24_01890 [Candidatus Bathyarchaeota archaeon]|nr:hypothetical protein [Candidatus Bathyarchaeota archaeon]
MFPKAPDQHKPNQPLVPNGLGIFYVLLSTVYLFLLYYFEHFFRIFDVSNNVSPSLMLAVCILFGGFLGLLDDWIDLKWRYKAFLPLIASIPLISLAWRLELRTAVTLPLIGVIDFTTYGYYFIIIPLLVTVVTNVVNQLGGLNGLETVCPAIILAGLAATSGPYAILLCGPLAVWLVLAFFNVRGKIFVGNTGSFAIGITLASFAIISNLKVCLAVSVLPYVFNSSLILLTYFLFKAKASVSFDGKKLTSSHRRSLVTLVTYQRALTERQVVLVISLLIAASTALGLWIQSMAM